jgi:hypothetical protein
MLMSPTEVTDRYSELVNGEPMSTNEGRALLGLHDVADGDTGAQQLAHPDTPGKPQARGPRAKRLNGGVLSR